MTSVVTPFHNGFDLLPDFERATFGAELVIIDNGSDEETATALQTLPPDRGRVIRNETNTGFAAANNQGYAQATGDIIVFLNSDIAGDPAWLKAVADDVHDGALYGPSLGQQFVAGRWLPYLEGWCVAATRATWELLRTDPSRDKEAAEHGIGVAPFIGWRGPWDALFYPGPYWEDNDLCFRALQAGVALIQTSWQIQHKGGRTAGALAKHAASLEANRATFASRVLAAIEQPPALTPAYAAYQQHVHTQSDIQHHLPLLFSLAHGNVLELGTRTGVSTAALLAGVERAGGHVWSIDLDDCSHVAAGHPQWTFVHGSSTDPNLVASKTGLEPFDLILVDTEHTYEQASAELALWGPHIKPGGTIAMHDPETFPGVRRAAREFAAVRGWPLTIVLPCNGMAVIERPKNG